MPDHLNRLAVRFLGNLLGFAAVCFGSANAGAEAISLPPAGSWERSEIAVKTSGGAAGEAIELSVPINYKIGRLRSPTVAVRPGELLTTSAGVETEYRSGIRSHYLAWIELEFSGAKGAIATVASPELVDTQPLQPTGVTAVAPAGATTVRVNVCLQNKLYAVIENRASIRDLKLERHEGAIGNGLELSIADPLPAGGGERRAEILVKADAPDGAAVRLTTSRGRLPLAVLVKDRKGAAALEYAGDDLGRAEISASLGELKTATTVLDPRAGELRIAAVRADGAAGPALVQLAKDGKTIPGRDAPAAPGFFTEFPWSYELGPGSWQVRISRGPHFAAYESTVTIEPGKPTELRPLELKRIADLRGRGWYGGDADGDVYHGEQIFTDVTAGTAALIGRAMGLDWIGVGSWRKPSPPSWAEARKVMEELSGPDLLFKYTDEKPKTRQGHACVVGLQRPDTDRFHWGWTGSGDDGNHQLLQVLQADGVATFANHPLRWWMSGGKFRTNLYCALPFDLCAAGVLDGVNINDKGEKSLALWSLLLDHGYPVAATAGADFCLDRPGGPPPGLHRMYCYCPEGMTWPGLAEAVRRQNTVVSTGAVLVPSLDGKPPGTTVPAGRQYSIRAEGWARGDMPDTIRRVELWAHGKPIAVKQFAKSEQVRHVDETFPWTPSGDYDWVSVRLINDQGWAMSSAFYAAAPDWKPPQRPVRSNVRLTISGLKPNEFDGATLEVWSNQPTLLHAKKLSTEPLRQEHKLEVPVTAVLVARTAKGRTAQTTVYDASGARSMIEFIIGGERRDEPLLNWETYEKLLEACRDVKGTIEFQ